MQNVTSSYNEAISLLTSTEKFHINLGLERVQRILEYFGNPQDRIKCIHIAGTNGKGSTCAMLASVLTDAGYKTGLYTSPHLIEYTERIRINSQNISQEDFAQTVFRVIEQTEPQNIVYYDEKNLPVFDGEKPKINREILCFYKRYFQGKKIHHRILGEIKLFDAGIRKTIHINNIRDLKLLIKLDELIKNGKYIKTQTPCKKRKDGIVRFHTLLVKIKINGLFKNLEIKIAEDNKEKKFYFYKEQIPGALPGKTEVSGAFDYTLPGRRGNFNPAYPETKIPATEFEILTAAAFIYFYEGQADFAVIETGLGGRLDATNIIKKPELTIITDIDLDHTARLGNSIEQIAYEKAGIIKHEVPVITLEDNKGLDVIKKRSSYMLSPLILAKPEEIKEAEPGLKGLWHGRNLSLVKQAVRLLKNNGVNIPEKAENIDIEKTRWLARFQYIKEENLIIDAAHNPAAAILLRKSLDKYFPGSGRIFIYSSLNTKDYKSVTDILFRENDRVILTKSSSCASVKPEIIGKYIKNRCKSIYLTQNVVQAIEICRKIFSRGDLIIFTGSIYSIGEFLVYKNK